MATALSEPTSTHSASSSSDAAGLDPESPVGSIDVVADQDSTRERLVVSAAEVFAERGYDKAGVAEIARRAGLTTGAIYSRFSGKAELLAETIRRYCSDEFDALFAQHHFQGRAADLLATVGAHLVTRERTPGRAILLEAFVAARRDPEVADALREHLEERAERLAAMIDESKAAGMVAADVDTRATVHFAHAVGLGFLLFDAVGAEHPHTDAWQDVVERVVAAFVPDEVEAHAAAAVVHDEIQPAPADTAHHPPTAERGDTTSPQGARP